jgi:hypothetical protein
MIAKTVKITTCSQQKGKTNLQGKPTRTESTDGVKQLKSDRTTPHDSETQKKKGNTPVLSNKVDFSDGSYSYMFK